jgi:hypothetical protein
MRWARARAAAVSIALTLVPACGGGLGGFTPATQPADVCSLLPLLDIKTVLPTAAAGVARPGMTMPDQWKQECDWIDNRGLYVSPAIGLFLEGAVTPQGNSNLDVEFVSIGGGPMQGTAVGGLGTKALYFNVLNGMSQFLEARTGSYLVSVEADNFPSPVSEAQLEPLVRKVISGH